jgi:hypothetical protein
MVDIPAPTDLTAWPLTSAEAVSVCANCATPLAGPFCHACGQSAEDFERKIGSLLAESFAHLFHADGRLLRTLPKLVVNPARLTREYLAGHRAAQMPPLRLFLVAIVVFFLAGSLREMAHPMAPLFQKDFPAETTPSFSPGSSPAVRAFAAWLNPRLTAAVTHQREFGAAVEGWLHRIAIAFLPVSTLLLGLLFVFQRRFLLFDHAIFSMHSLAFMALLFSVVTLLSIAPPLRGLAGPLMLAAPIHLFAHMRGAYGASIIGTLARMLLLFVLSAAAMALLLLGVVGLELNGMTQ